MPTSVTLESLSSHCPHKTPTRQGFGVERSASHRSQAPQTPCFLFDPKIQHREAVLGRCHSLCSLRFAPSPRVLQHSYRTFEYLTATHGTIKQANSRKAEHSKGIRRCSYDFLCYLSLVRYYSAIHSIAFSRKFQVMRIPIRAGFTIDQLMCSSISCPCRAATKKPTRPTNDADTGQETTT